LVIEVILTKRRLGIVIVAALVSSAATIVMGESVVGDVIEVPVDRVIANLERLIAKSPKDPVLLLNLARTHVMAFALKSGTIRVTRSEEEKGPATAWMQNNVQPRVSSTQDPVRLQEARAHLANGIARYEETIRLDSSNGVARLGYAWALQQSGASSKAIAAYREAVKLGYPEDVKGGLIGFQTVTQEAAKYLIPLLDPNKDKDEIASLREKAAKIQAEQRVITPIAVPLRDGLTAQEITNARARVPFDLNGSALPQRWTWITPDAAWLVMDRHGRQQIRSGLQLFGSVTFWLFWENGYHAMRALDDDGDGRLRGEELTGLALWRDANSDGVSDTGEIRSVAEWNIAELSCEYRHDPTHPDEIAFSPLGVRFNDGRTRPTFDVVLRGGITNNESIAR
jgi:hypothetical protein